MELDNVAVPDSFYENILKSKPRNEITIDFNVICKLRPCTDRFIHYKDHYSNFSGTFSEFCDLELLTNADKKWVAKKVFDREHKFNLAMLILYASIGKSEETPRVLAKIPRTKKFIMVSLHNIEHRYKTSYKIDRNPRKGQAHTFPVNELTTVEQLFRFINDRTDNETMIRVSRMIRK